MTREPVLVLQKEGYPEMAQQRSGRGDAVVARIRRSSWTSHIPTLLQGHSVLLNCFQDGLPITLHRHSCLAQCNFDAHGVSASSRSKASNTSPHITKPPSTPSTA